jgi:hypothetical protein
MLTRRGARLTGGSEKRRPARQVRAGRRAGGASARSRSSLRRALLQHPGDLLVEVVEVEGLVEEVVRAVERRGQLVQALADAGEYQDAGSRGRLPSRSSRASARRGSRDRASRAGRRGEPLRHRSLPARSHRATSRDVRRDEESRGHRPRTGRSYQPDQPFAAPRAHRPGAGPDLSTKSVGWRPAPDRDGRRSRNRRSPGADRQVARTDSRERRRRATEPSN